VPAYTPPDSEYKRLDALKSYKILDSLPEQEYDAITRLASYICQTPIALITLLDNERQWFKSKIGIDIDQTSIEDSFCRYTILGDDLLEVSDTQADDRFANNRFVTNEPGIRFYAGAPLTDEDGYRLGSLCVIDNVPHTLTQEQRDALKILSREVISHLTLRRQKRELEASVLQMQEFYNLFNSSPDIHCITDKQGIIEVVNNTFTRITGYEPADIIGKPLWHFFINNSKGNTTADFKRSLLQNKQVDLQTLIDNKYGETRWINWCLSNNEGKWYINGRDNTQQKKVRAELEQLSLVANKISNGVAIADAENKMIWVNAAFTKITDYELDDVKGKQLSDVLGGDYNNPEVLTKTEELLKSKKPFEYELQIETKTGKGLWLSIISSVILNSAGEVEKYIKILINITPRKLAEHDLNILSFAARKSPSGILIRDKNSAVVWMNEAFEKITGFTLAEMKGKMFGKMLLGKDSDVAVFEKARDMASKNRPYELELKIYRKDKTPLWIYLSNSPMFNETGDLDRQVGVIVDITERKAAEQQLTMLSLVASNSLSGMIINDGEGKIEWVNEAFTHITGYGLDDVKHRHLGDVLKGELTDISIIEKARELSRKKQSFEVDLLVYRKDGQPLWISVINSVILNNDGKIDKYVEVVIDITAKKKAELELIATKEEALQLGRAKEMFVSVMSHEIRTPLNAIIGISRLLNENEALPSQKENLDILKFSSNNLMMLINDVLDFTKIETGNIQLEKAEVNLREIVHGVVATLQIKSLEKNIYIHTHIDDDIPEIVTGDSTRIMQILLNLTSNAVKFTEKGGVDIDLKAIEQNAQSVRIRFAVSDTGIGIAADNINSIFDAWKQAESNTTRKYGGTGLGLAISKRLVTLHDSRINVDSIVGTGSTFWFTISFDKVIEHSDNKKDKLEETLNLHALVVDDNQINRLLINKVLKKWGATADFAENGLEAVEKIKANKNYDVVLMDIHMPKMGGLEATKLIREMPETYFRQLSIIALTASMLNSQMSNIEGAGMNDYILKPFEPKILFEKLSRYQKQ